MLATSPAPGDSSSPSCPAWISSSRVRPGPAASGNLKSICAAPAGRCCLRNDGPTSKGGRANKRNRSSNCPAIPPDGGQRLFQLGRKITMTRAKWNESGRVWEEDHGLLDAEQVSKCERADVAEPLRAPVPTRMISNGEYMPTLLYVSDSLARNRWLEKVRCS